MSRVHRRKERGERLRAGYAWVVVQPVLRAVAAAGFVTESLAFHAPAVGTGALWSAGVGIYFVRYRPILTQPRLDGRPG